MEPRPPHNFSIELKLGFITQLLAPTSQLHTLAMKERNIVCIFCRHNNISKYPLRTSKRWQSTGEASFVLPRVVIDLDAADNKNVKSFEDLTPQEKEQSLAAYSRRRSFRKVAPSPTITPRYRKLPPSWYKFELDKNVATPSDLLSYALLGEIKNDYSAQLGRAKIYEKHHVRPQDAVTRKVEELANDFVVDDLARLQKAGFTFTAENIDSLRERISECRKLNVLQEILGLFTTSRRGCQLIADMEVAIVESIRLCRLRQKTYAGSAPSSKVLELLNNLHLNMHSKGVEMGPVLLGRAIHYAGKAASLPAVRKYLSEASKLNAPAERHFNNSVMEVLNSYLELDQLELSETQIQSHWDDTLSVVTGWKTGNSVQADEPRQISFGKYLEDNHLQNMRSLMFRRYIHTLARLGLTDSLRALWEAHESLNKTQKQNHMRINSVHGYALAFCIAGDPAQALIILKTIASAPIHPGEGSMNSRKQLKDIIFADYKSRNLIASYQFWARVTSDLSIPRDPEQALVRLQRYLVPDYERGSHLRKITTVTVEGQEAIGVYPLEQGRPLYAKALPLVTDDAGTTATPVTSEAGKDETSHGQHEQQVDTAVV